MGTDLSYSRVHSCSALLLILSKQWAVGFLVRLSTSPGYPRLTTGIPVGKPTGMETRGSESPVITGPHGSGCMFWVLRVPATSTCQTIGIFIFYLVNLPNHISHS